MTDIVVNCKGSMVHPRLIKTVLSGQMGLDREAQKQAQVLYLLAGTLSKVPAGILLDLVVEKLAWAIDEQNETFTILNAEMPATALDPECEQAQMHDHPGHYKFCPMCGGEY